MALFSRGHKRKIGLGSVYQDAQSKRTGSVDVAIRPQEETLTYLKESGNFFDISDKTELSQLRNKIRTYSIYNDALSIAVNLSAMFISADAHIVCEDNQNQEKLQIFFESLDFEDFLQEFAKEFLISGEATSFASWSDEDQSFTDEQILNPDSIEIKSSIFKNEDTIIIGVPEKVKEVFEDEDNPEHQYATTNLKDLYQATSSNRGLNVDNDKIVRVVNKARAWDNYGVPFFTGALPALSQIESLDAALYEQLSTLITPTIIGTVGLRAGDLGQNSNPWIPTQGELDKIKDTYKMMLLAKFRLGVFPIGVDFKNAFASSNIPDLGNNYERCTKAILRCIGAGQGLIDGSSAGPFASNAINRDVYASFLTNIRKKIIKAYQRRIDTAIKKLDLHAYRTNQDGKREEITTKDGKPIYERAVLSFDDSVMKDANDTLSTLLQLRSADVPVSKQTLADASKTGLQVAEEIKKLKDESSLTSNIDADDVVDIANNNGQEAKKPESESDNLKSPLDSRNF